MTLFPAWVRTCVPALLLTGMLAGCASVDRSPGTVPPQSWDAFKQRRAVSIAGTNGWATLVGLLWMEEGRHVLGSGPTATLRLPAGRAPEVVGELVRTGRTVKFTAAPGVSTRLHDAGADSSLLSPVTETNDPPILQVGDLRMFVIYRGPRVALRVKDPLAPTRVHFKGLEYFPYSETMKVVGKLEAPAKGRMIQIADVTGAVTPTPSAGVVRFKLHGVEQTLEATEDDDTHDLWFVFRDGTSGKSTYGGGRFLHAPMPSADGSVVLDFNFAYTPPCAFTPFATCPVPPRQNWLTVAIPAGERKYAGGHE